jgi:hypothetical protein
MCGDEVGLEPGNWGAGELRIGTGEVKKEQKDVKPS